MTRRLVYISRSLVGPDPAILANILTSSAVRNDLCGVTGMLWWSADTFAQVLEGGPEAIDVTMKRIGRDPRHTDIKIVEDREVISRMFGNWSMTEADDSAAGIAATSFLVGFCAGRKGHGAQRLLDFLITHT